MAFAGMGFASSQSATVLVPAEPDQRIRITRLVITTGGEGNFSLLSDPGGPDVRTVVPSLYLAAGGALDLPLGREFALSTDRGKALGLSSQITGTNTKHSVLVWYELVD